MKIFLIFIFDFSKNEKWRHFVTLLNVLFKLKIARIDNMVTFLTIYNIHHVHCNDNLEGRTLKINVDSHNKLSVEFVRNCLTRMEQLLHDLYKICREYNRKSTDPAQPTLFKRGSSCIVSVHILLKFTWMSWHSKNFLDRTPSCVRIFISNPWSESVCSASNLVCLLNLICYRKQVKLKFENENINTCVNMIRYYCSNETSNSRTLTRKILQFSIT